MKKSFNERCYEVLRRVPEGHVVTYKQIAEKLKGKAYRAVGMAMKMNPYAPRVPCGESQRQSGFQDRLDRFHRQRFAGG